MLELFIPGRGDYELEHLVLDVNGTVAAGGQLIDGVKDRLHTLRQAGWQIHWITADTRGRQPALDEQLGWPAHRLATDGSHGEADQKAAFVQSLEPKDVVAIGNGANDAAMLRQATIGIAVLGPEGLAIDALLTADAIAPNIHAALDMLIDPSRLLATLRH